MSRCWAAAIGGCSGKLSGEHYISKSQFDSEKITVQGFRWCLEPKEIPLLSAVANILCEAHNHALSPVDREARRVLDGLLLAQWRVAEDLPLVRLGLPPNRWPRKMLKLSGDLFERWLLKTTINFATAGQPLPQGGIFGPDGSPAKKYVEIAFGLGRFNPPEGFSWVAEVGEKVPFKEMGTVRFSSLMEPTTNAMVGAEMGFHGNRLWLAAEGAPVMTGAVRHLRRWRAKNVGVTLHFNWLRQLPTPGGQRTAQS